MPPALPPPHAGFELDVLTGAVQRALAVTNVENVALMQFPPSDTMYDNLMLYRDIKVGGGSGGGLAGVPMPATEHCTAGLPPACSDPMSRRPAPLLRRRRRS